MDIKTILLLIRKMSIKTTMRYHDHFHISKYQKSDDMLMRILFGLAIHPIIMLPTNIVCTRIFTGHNKMSG